MSNLNLRVYRRSSEDIILAWNTKYLIPDQIDNIVLSIGDKDLEVIIATADGTEGVPKGNVTALIPYKENSLKADEEYFVTVKLGVQRPIRQQIQVFPSGVLPSKTQDDVKKISQLYGFNESDKKWQKINLINKDGVFCVPVYIVNFDEAKKKK